MRKLLLAATALVGLSAPAFAADLPPMATKAPVMVPGDLSGWYWGVEAGAGVQQTSTSGTLFANSLVSGKLNAAGGTVGGCFGYMTGYAARWYAVQGCVDYQNISAGEIVANVPLGVASRWSGTVEFRLGGNSMNPLGTIQTALTTIGVPNLTFPTFQPVPPGGVNVAPGPRSYIAGGLDIYGVTGGIGTANGAVVAVAPMLKLGYIWQVLDANGKQTGGAVDVSAAVSQPMRGFTVDNLGGQGAPIFTGGIDTGTRYFAKIAYDLPIPR